MGSKTKSRATRKKNVRLFLAAAIILAIAGVLFLIPGSPFQSKSISRFLKPGAATGYNLLLITLDTVRSDRIGTYGYEKGETPFIDALANEGVQFDDAVSHVPITLPSHSTMMTGLYPPRHGVRDNGLFQLSEDRSTLAERLKEEGYETAAFIGCFVLDERYGIAQGFDVYDFEVTREGFQMSNFDLNQRPADVVTQSALKWLREHGRPGADRPFFMWVHYFDAHIPFQSPLTSLPRFKDRPYDAEIAFIDMQLGRLLGELDRLNLRERTLIALVADHGEGMKEHGESTHGLFVYDSTLRVPFILSSPSIWKGPHRVRDRMASLADLRPTLEDLLGLPLSGEMDGISLLSGGNEPDRGVYIETKMPYYMARCSSLHGIRRHNSKYIDAPEPEFYDLGADPGEENNRYTPDGREGAEMAEELDRLRESWDATDGESPGRRAMSEEEIERLAALGYVQSSGKQSSSKNLPDPKALIRSMRKLGEAIRFQLDGRLEDAIRTAEEALGECEGNIEVHTMLAEFLREADREEEAVQVLRRSLDSNPLCGTALQLARTYMTMRDYREMEDALRIAYSIDPDNGFIYIIRGDLFSFQERLPEAVAQYEKALEVDKHRTGMIAQTKLKRARSRLR